MQARDAGLRSRGACVVFSPGLYQRCPVAARRRQRQLGFPAL